MAQNHIGPLEIGPLKTAIPGLSQRRRAVPGHVEELGPELSDQYAGRAGGRSAGSLAWAGLANTYFWIDRTRNVTGVFLSQVLPFYDETAPVFRQARDRGLPGPLGRPGVAMTAHTPSHPPLGADTLERLRQISTPTLCTQLFKLGFRNMYLHGVRPLCPDKRMAGEAVTVRFAPAREDRAGYEVLADPGYPQRHAIEHIERGQVLVMDCRGVASAANAGDILVSRLQVRGAAGLVLDGGIRDYPSVQQFGFPVYALGPAAPAHVVRHVAVDENVPIGCAEVLVVPGDVMVGDGEGVVCIPRAVADTVAAHGLEQEELEAFLLEKVRAGAPLPGTYPPNEQTLAEYETWKRRRGTI